MLFVLIHENFDDSSLKGIFSDVEKAKDFAKNYAKTTFGQDNLNWSNPNIVDSIWANTHGGTLFISPAELDPTTHA